MRVTGGWNSCQLVIWTMMSRKGICKCLQGPGGHSWRCASNVVKSTLLAKSKCICPDYKLHLSRFVSSVDCGATLRKGASNAVNASSLPNVRQADKYLIWQGDKYQKWQADKYSNWSSKLWSQHSRRKIEEATSFIWGCVLHSNIMLQLAVQG